MLAERENKVDLIAGIDKELDNEVFSILLDLQKKEILKMLLHHLQKYM